MKPGIQGIVSSPGYPISYPHDIYCRTHLKTTSSSYRVRLIFNSTFHIEDSHGCQMDYLKIIIREHMDGDLANNDSTYFLLCGKTSPQEIISIGDIDIIFKSNSHKSYQGFSLVYEYIRGGEYFLLLYSAVSCK